MNKVETAKILAIASGFDRRVVDDLTATSWSIALADVEFDDCYQAVIAHFTDPLTRHAYLTVGHILDRVQLAQRMSLDAIAADVRSAKARGLVDADWSVTEQLPADVREALDKARRNELDLIRELTS